MKKAFVLAAVAAVALVPETQAADLSFLDGPYEFLDEVVMFFYKPLIWAVVIGWAQAPACDIVLSMALDAFISDSSTMSADDQDTYCKEGIKMYWEQFFYGGPVGNQPYQLGWAWSPS